MSFNVKRSANLLENILKLSHKKWFHALSVSYNHVPKKPNKKHVSTSNKNSFKLISLSVLLSKILMQILNIMAEVVLQKICSKFTGKHPCQGEISIKLQNNFIEVTLRHVCCPVNLLHIFNMPFPKTIYGGLLLIR